MIKSLKKQYRKLHISNHWLRLGPVHRFHKISGRFLNIKERVPNLVILGAQKCGTTSLFHYLNQHGDICGSFPEKEPGFFIFNEFTQRYFNQYKNLHIRDRDDLVRRFMNRYLADHYFFLDASTYYTQDENERRYNIASRIQKESPDCKFIYLIRNPFQRLISAYFHQKRAGESESFIERVNNSWNINTSLYYDRIKSYVDVFGRDKILILNMEDLQSNPKTVLKKVFSFLNLENKHRLEYLIHNKTSPDKVNLKFDLQTYTKLHSLFLEQKEAMEREYGVVTNWDLSIETWVQN